MVLSLLATLISKERAGGSSAAYACGADLPIPRIFATQRGAPRGCWRSPQAPLPWQACTTVGPLTATPRASPASDFHEATHSEEAL
jgi:hypothetical protein